VVGFLRSLLVPMALLAVAVTPGAATDLATLQQNYVDQDYGMFLHFNMGTFTNAEWTAPNQNPNLFNPVTLDTDQWAATAKAAGMKYGVLTTKHHDGFALWNTNQSTYDVANPACSWYSNPSSPYYHCDIVQSFADSFRNEGLGVGLYYSIWDRSNGINGTRSSAAATAYVKAEIHHLLTSYGSIEVLWTDGWGWQSSVGYDYVDYEEVYSYIKEISPNTLLLENTYTGTLAHTDIVGYEQSLPWETNTLPSETYPTLRADSQWFYKTYDVDLFKTAEYMGDYIRTANARNATCLLNIGPDRNGLIQTSAVQRLMEIKDNLDNPPQPRPGNVALDRPAVQSSTWPDFPADKGVDGEKMNFCHTFWNDFFPWWKVDLGEMKSIGEIDLWNRDGYGGRLRDITIEILAEDGLTVVYTSSLLNPGNVLGGGVDDYADGPDPITLTLDGDGVIGRYVRVRRTPQAGYQSDETGNKYLLTLAEVEVYRTYIPGDADGDGTVDATDAQALAQHWGDGDATWEMGDFDRDGTVGPKDASILAANWGHGSSEAANPAVPEPTLAMLMLGVLAAMGLRGTVRRPSSSPFAPRK